MYYGEKGNGLKSIKEFRIGEFVVEYLGELVN